MKHAVDAASTRFFGKNMQKENNIGLEQDFPAEKIVLINRILKECTKLELFKSEKELDDVFDALSQLDLNHLNQILDDKNYKKDVFELIQK